MTYLDVVIVAFIALWTLVTIVATGSKLLLFFMKADLPWMRPLKPYYEAVLSCHSAIKSLDVFRLLAKWNFFCKDGDWYNLYVYVRGFRSDCTFTPWKDVTPKDRAGAVKFSFPTKHESRAIRNVTMILSIEPDRGTLLLSKPGSESSQVDEPGDLKPMIRRLRYQFLLQYIRLQSFDPAVEWCQFVLATSKDDVPPLKGVTTPPDFTVPNRYVLFVSPFHKVNPQDASPSSSNTDSTNVNPKEREETALEKRAVAASVNERYAAVY